MQGEPFYAHPGLISRLSKPLARLIEDPLRSEKKRDYNRCPKDVSTATFDRFLEWAYQGYYTQPSPTIDSNGGNEVEGKTEQAPRATTPNGKEPDMPVIEDELPQSPAIPDLDWGNFGSKKKSKKGSAKQSFWGVEATAIDPPEPAPSQREELKKAFCNFDLTTPPKPNDQTLARKNLDACEDYTKIFLCHAELYVFAFQNEIEDLSILALNRLHAVLAVFKLHRERTGDIIALLGYSYAKTKSPDSGKEPLRDLLTRYVAFEMDTLMLDERFEELIIGNSDMHSNYMSSVLKRIKS